MHVALAATVLIAATTVPPAPIGDAFYQPPAPLPAGDHGTVVWASPWTGPPVLDSAAKNVRFLYETTAYSGQAVAVSGTLSVPRGSPPSGGWPIVAWAHGTTGNAPQCAPSRWTHKSLEAGALDRLVAREYAIVQTDYEGNGTAGIHPYYFGTSSARDMADAVIAARAVDGSLGTQWVAMGHSEGGAAALATGVLGQRWAPALQLLGVAAYAPASHFEDFVTSALHSDEPNGAYAYLGLLAEGFATVDPRLDIDTLLSPEAHALLPALQQRCIDDVASNSGWARIVPAAIFRSQASDQVDDLYHDIIANDPENFTIPVPVLLLQGVSDPLVNPAATLDMHERYCRRHMTVQLIDYLGATHGTVLQAADDDVALWLSQRFAHAPAKSNC